MMPSAKVSYPRGLRFWYTARVLIPWPHPDPRQEGHTVETRRFLSADAAHDWVAGVMAPWELPG